MLDDGSYLPYSTDLPVCVQERVEAFIRYTCAWRDTRIHRLFVQPARTHSRMHPSPSICVRRLGYCHSVSQSVGAGQTTTQRQRAKEFDRNPEFFCRNFRFSLSIPIGNVSVKVHQRQRQPDIGGSDRIPSLKDLNCTFSIKNKLVPLKELIKDRSSSSRNIIIRVCEFCGGSRMPYYIWDIYLCHSPTLWLQN